MRFSKNTITKVSSSELKGLGTISSNNWVSSDHGFRRSTSLQLIKPDRTLRPGVHVQLKNIWPRVVAGDVVRALGDPGGGSLST